MVALITLNGDITMDTPTGTTLNALAAKVRIDNAFGRVPSDRLIDAWHRDAHNYRVTLRYQGRRIMLDYFMGPALTDEPSAAGVLDSLLSDAQAGAESFAEFCGTFGYDRDSRTAYRAWIACRQNGQKVRRLLGADFDASMAAERD